MHDPAQAPDPAWWLSLDEITRGDALRDFHAAHPNPALHGMMRNLDLHCSMHAVVETQVAEQDPPIVAATIARPLTAADAPAQRTLGRRNGLAR